MDVEDSYKGPRMTGNNKDGYTLDLDFVKAMLQEFKEQRLIHRWVRVRAFVTACVVACLLPLFMHACRSALGTAFSALNGC